MEFKSSNYRSIIFRLPITNNVENRVLTRESSVSLCKLLSFCMRDRYWPKNFRPTHTYRSLLWYKWLETAIRFNWILLVLNALRFVRTSTFDRSLNSPQRKYVKCAASRNLNCGRGLLLKYIVITVAFIERQKRIFERGYFYF